MSSEFSREIRKLEVRLGDYVEAEQEFVKYAQECVRILRKLMEHLRKIGRTPSSEEIEKLSRLRRNAIQSLSQVLKNESQVEHEKSHVFESYGALILSLGEYEKIGL